MNPAAIGLLATAIVAGGIVVYIMFDMAKDTNEEIQEFTASPAGEAPTLANSGQRAYPVQDVHLVVVQGGQFLRVSQIALTQQVGDTWDPGESVCIAGDGCLLPWTQAVSLRLTIDDTEHRFEFTAPAVDPGDQAPEDLPQPPSLLP